MNGLLERVHVLVCHCENLFGLDTCELHGEFGEHVTISTCHCPNPITKHSQIFCNHIP